MLDKLENPERVAELNPRGTLRAIGLGSNDVFCDIGAGSGLFTFAAAEITSNTVHAVDTSSLMLNILRKRNKNSNVFIQEAIEIVSDVSTDMALMCTVLHELDSIPNMIDEIRRILKADGSLAIIEFHKVETPVGPPSERRISEDEASALITEGGFAESKRFTLGENFYCIVFKKVM